MFGGTRASFVHRVDQEAETDASSGGKSARELNGGPSDSVSVEPVTLSSSDLVNHEGHDGHEEKCFFVCFATSWYN